MNSPLKTGDKISIIDSKGAMTSATVLSCSMDFAKNQKSWSVTVWLSESREVQVVDLKPYSQLVLKYTTDLEI